MLWLGCYVRETEMVVAFACTNTTIRVRPMDVCFRAVVILLRFVRLVYYLFFFFDSQVTIGALEFR